MTTLAAPVALTIGSLLAASALSSCVISDRIPRSAVAKAHIATFQGALHAFDDVHSRYPTTEQGIAILATEGHLEGGIPTDPWNRPYLYEAEGRSFRVATLGADGQPGGEGEDADLVATTAVRLRPR